MTLTFFVALMALDRHIFQGMHFERLCFGIQINGIKRHSQEGIFYYTDGRKRRFLQKDSITKIGQGGGRKSSEPKGTACTIIHQATNRQKFFRLYTLTTV